MASKKEQMISKSLVHSNLNVAEVLDMKSWFLSSYSPSLAQLNWYSEWARRYSMSKKRNQLNLARGLENYEVDWFKKIDKVVGIRI